MCTIIIYNVERKSGGLSCIDVGVLVPVYLHSLNAFLSFSCCTKSYATKHADILGRIPTRFSKKPWETLIGP